MRTWKLIAVSVVAGIVTEIANSFVSYSMYDTTIGGYGKSGFPFVQRHLLGDSVAYYQQAVVLNTLFYILAWLIVLFIIRAYRRRTLQ